MGSDFRRLLAAYARRMFHPSEFMKTLKQNMTMSFNARRDHAGTIWEGRFYDKRSDPTAKDMSAQAAYVDCNPTEAGICRNPAEYKWCSWAAAMAGDEHARGMYRFVYDRCLGNRQFCCQLPYGQTRVALYGVHYQHLIVRIVLTIVRIVLTIHRTFTATGGLYSAFKKIEIRRTRLAENHDTVFGYLVTR